jgi:hypothetical protein
MARIRSVKPEFWQDEDLADVTRDARLLYIGLWNLADEHGRLRGDPRYVKGQLFPYDDDLSPSDIGDLIKELEVAGKVLRYTAQTRADKSARGAYMFLPNLGKHQRLEAEKVPSKLPEPPDPATSSQVNDHPGPSAQIGADKSARDADQSEPGADKNTLLYGTGSMEHGAWDREHDSGAAPDADEPQSKPTKRATRIPENFTVEPKMIEWAAERAPLADGQRETEKFINHFQAASGPNASKRDWVAAWRNWMLRAQENAERNPPRSGRPGNGNSSGYEPYRNPTDPNAYAGYTHRPRTQPTEDDDDAA